ncbi:unnamed protein product [Camellia sinensis]
MTPILLTAVAIPPSLVNLRLHLRLVCKWWLHLQSTERHKLASRAGPHMLRKMAARFTRLHELGLSQSISRSFYPDVIDSDLSVIANSFTCLGVLSLQNCKKLQK